MSWRCRSQCLVKEHSIGVGILVIGCVTGTAGLLAVAGYSNCSTHGNGTLHDVEDSDVVSIRTTHHVVYCSWTATTQDHARQCQDSSARSSSAERQVHDTCAQEHINAYRTHTGYIITQDS